MNEIKGVLSVLNTMTTPSALLRSDGVVEGCNAAWNEMGQSCDLLASLFPPPGGSVTSGMGFPESVLKKLNESLPGGHNLEERFSIETGHQTYWFHLRTAALTDFPDHSVCYLQEIIAQTIPEQQHLHLQEQFELITNHLEDIVFRLRLLPEPNLEYISPSAAEITGYTIEELENNPGIWLGWFMPDNCPLSENGIVPQSPNKKFTIPIIRKDSSRIWLEISSVLKFDAAGNLSAIFGFARDITRQIESEENYQALVNNVMEELIIIQDDRVVYANPTALTRSGFLMNELFSFQVSDILELVHPQDRALAENIIRGFPEMEDRTDPIDVRIINKLGKTRWSSISVIRINYKNYPAYLLLILDISKSKQAEITIRESEEHFRSLFEEAPLPYQSLDENGNIITVNQAWERALGYSRDEVIGHPVSEFVAPSYVDAFLERFPRFKRTGKIVNLEFDLLRKDGTVINTSYNGRIGHGPNGEFTQTHCIFSDVTEQKNATQKLLKSEARYRQLFNTMMNGFAVHEIILDESGKPCDYRFLEVNPAFETMVKLSAADMIGKTFLEVWPEADNFWIEAYGKVAITGTPVHFERYFAQLDMYVDVYTYQPGEGRFATLFTDITQRTRAEQMMQLVTSGLEAAANGIVIMDKNLIVEWVNPAFVQMYGLTIHESLGKSINTLVRSDVLPAEFYNEVDQTLAAGLSWSGDLIDRRKDGELRNMQITITPVAISGDQISHFIEIIQDVTEVREQDRQQHMIVNISQALRGAETPDQIVRIVMDELKELIRTDGAAVVIYDSQESFLEVKYAQGSLGTWLGARFPDNQGVSGHVVTTRQFYLQNDMGSDPHALRVEGRFYPRAMAGFPLIAQNSTLGVLLVGKNRDFVQSDINVLNTVGEILANAMRRSMLAEQTQRHLHQMEALHRIDKAIASNQVLQETLTVLLDEVCEQLQISRASIWLLEESTQTLRLKYSKGFTHKAPRFSTIKVGVGSIGRAVLENHTISLAIHNASSEDRDTLPSHWELEGLTYHIAVPLVAKNQVQGVMSLYPDRERNVNDEWWGFLEMLAGQCAIAIDNASMLQGLQRLNLDLTLAYDTTLEGWAHALEIRDHETEGHSRRVTELVMNMARSLGIPESEMAHVRRGALLHDIGKMGIPDSILNKPGPLTEEEWSVMRQHPNIAFRLLSSISYLRPALDIPYCHHERWDGSGYPRRLKGEQIPLAARIFAVIDVWDALTSDRPYRSAWSVEKTLDYIREQSGQHFDPQVVEAFLRLIGS